MADPVSIGITLALTAVQMGMAASRKIEGPRLDSLKYTGGDYGSPLARVWGMRRLEAPIFFAEDLKEVKRRRKTKGGKYNDYTYYGTFAALAAGHRIDAIRRIWFDRNLVYDLSGPGPVTPFEFGTNATGTQLSDYITIYLGGEDQEPDPRMQATIEAQFGPGSCPAYRGTAFAMFRDVPLEKIGNRIPQVSLEVVGNSTANWPYSTTSSGFNTSYRTFSPDFSLMVRGGGFDYDIIDTASRAIMIEGAQSPANGGLTPQLVIDNDGTFYGISNADTSKVYSYSPEGIGSEIGDGTVSYGSVWGVEDGNGDFNVFATNASGGYYMRGGAEATLGSGKVCGVFCDLDGALWLTIQQSGTSAKFLRVDPGAGTDSIEVTGLPSVFADTYPAGAVHYRDATVDHIVFYWKAAAGPGYLYAVDRTTGAINFTYTLSDLTAPRFRDIRPGVSTIWAGFREISLADLTLVRAVPLSNWLGGGASYNHDVAYDPINRSLDTSAVGATFYYLDRVGSAGVTLGTIVADVLDLCGVDASEYDASDLTQTVAGYSVGAGSGKDWLEPALDIYDSDARPHGFALQFLRRGGAAGATIAYGTFAQPRDDSSLYETPGQGGSDLPALVSLQFADVDADQQPNLAYSGPLGVVDSVRKSKLDMSNMAMDADTARQLVARWHRRRWFERQPYGLALPLQRIALEPADVAPLALPGNRTVTARLDSMVIGADRTVTTEWRPDDASLAQLDGSAGATFDGRDAATIAVPLLSKGFFLDLPYLDDSDAQTAPTIYLLSAPYADGTWPGAVGYQAVDGEYSDEIGSVPTSSQATWGYASDALPDANPWLWDRGSSVTVVLQVGELTGTTEAAIDADPTLNLALIGDELVQFTTATLTGTKTYAVSGFKRGRRGTEWACGTHAVRDVFLLLDTAQEVTMGLSEVGTDLSFKAITAGRTSGFPEALAPFTGASLKPYAPCHLEAVKDSVTGDWTFTWVRRTRVGGALTSGTSIPLSEASEEYQITVGDGAASATHTITSATYAWDVATQIADTGAEVMEADLAWSVVQMSDAVGAGFVATA